MSLIYKLFKRRDRMKDEKLIKELAGKNPEELVALMEQVKEAGRPKDEPKPKDDAPKDSPIDLEALKTELLGSLKEEFSSFRTELDSVKDVVNKGIKAQPFGVQKQVQKDTPKDSWDNVVDNILKDINN